MFQRVRPSVHHRQCRATYVDRVPPSLSLSLSFSPAELSGSSVLELIDCEGWQECMGRRSAIVVAEIIFFFLLDPLVSEPARPDFFHLVLLY